MKRRGTTAVKRTLCLLLSLLTLMTITLLPVAAQADAPPRDPCASVPEHEDPFSGVCEEELVLCVATAVPPCHPLMPKGDNGALPGPVQFLVDSGYSVAQAWDQIEAQQRLTNMRRIALALFPATFAGAWIDHGDEGAVTLAFTLEAGASATVVVTAEEENWVAAGGETSAAAFPTAINVETAEYSFAELRALQQAVVAAAAPAEDEGIHLHSIGVKEDINRVLVMADASMIEYIKDVQAALLLDPGALEFLESGPVSYAAVECNGIDEESDRADCGPYLRGGLEIIRGGGRCTLGFGGVANGVPAILTAGHCGRGTWTHDGRVIGSTYVLSEGGRTPLDRRTSDAQSILVTNVWAPAGNPNGFTTTRWVYQSPQRQAYQIRDVSEVDEYVPGMVLCKSGDTTFETCGVLVSPSTDLFIENDPTDPFDDRYYTDQLAALICVQGGDSGGPLYTVETTETQGLAPVSVGAGITVASYLPAQCPTSLAGLDPFDMAWFTKSGWAEVDTQFTTRTW